MRRRRAASVCGTGGGPGMFTLPRRLPAAILPAGVRPGHVRQRRDPRWSTCYAAKGLPESSTDGRETLRWPAQAFRRRCQNERVVPVSVVRRRPASSAHRRRHASSRAARGDRCRASGPCPTPTSTRQREVVDAFRAAARGGDFDALVAVLDPDDVRCRAAKCRTASTVLVGLFRPFRRSLESGRPDRPRHRKAG